MAFNESVGDFLVQHFYGVLVSRAKDAVLDVVSVFPLLPANIADRLEEFNAPFVDRLLAVLTSITSKLEKSPLFSSKTLSELAPSYFVLVLNCLSDVSRKAAHLDGGLGAKGSE